MPRVAAVMNPLIDNSRWTPGPRDVRARVDAILADAKPQLTAPRQPQLPAAWPSCPVGPISPTAAAALAIWLSHLRAAYADLPDAFDMAAWQ